MSKVENQKEGKPRSDKPQKDAFAEFLKRMQGVDPDSVKQNTEGVDVVAMIDNRMKYFELKTSGKKDEDLKNDGYFGAASITEWECAIKHPDDFYFVYIIGQSQENYRYMMVKARNVFSYSTVPPFSIDINIKIRDYINKKKGFRKLETEGDELVLMNEVTPLKRKPRTPNQTSFGVNTEVVRRLCKFYDKEKKMYLAKINKKKKK